MLKFGIIGFGFMGQIHAAAMKKLPFTQLVAICDTNKDQFQYADEGIETFTNVDDLLKNKEINTVVIAVPNHLHYEMVAKVAAAKKDIFCEKPAAMSSKEFQKMMDVVEANHVHFTVDHERRFDRDYRLTKEVLDSKTLGDVYTIKNQLYGFNGNMHDWHVYPEYGGGMLMDWGVHLLDQMLWMIPGKLTTVFADIRNVINKDVDDYFNIQLYFDSGITGQVELGTYFLSDKKTWFERHWFISGDKGSAYVDGFNPQGKIVRTSELLHNVPGHITMTAAGATRSFGPAPKGRLITEPLPDIDIQTGTDESMVDMMYENYYHYLKGEGDLLVKPDEIMRLMKLVEAVRVSAKTHTSITFEH